MIKRVYRNYQFGVYHVIVELNESEYCKTHVMDDFGKLVKVSPIKVLMYGLRCTH